MTSVAVDCSATDRNRSRIQRAKVRGGINCRTNCWPSSNVFQTFYTSGIDRRRIRSPHQDAVRRIGIRRSGDRANSTFGTKIRSTVGVLLRNAGFAPIINGRTQSRVHKHVADVGRLVPAAGNRHRGNGVPRIRHHGCALGLGKTGVLVAGCRYRGTRVSTLRTTSRITTREERDSRDKKKRPCHRSTNLSNTIVAKRTLQCKLCRDKLATG